EFLFSLRLNGEKHGYVRCGDLVRALARLRAKGVSLHWVVHHLMGHSPPAVRELVQACGSGETIFWIHDFFTCCPNYELMRNDIVFCGIPAPDSQACGICCYGEERHEHLRQIQQLFAELRPVVFAPSEPALALWRDRSRLPHSGSRVVPLCELVFGGPVAPAPQRALRVAFLGTRNFIKGWTVFAELANRHS